MKGLKIVAKYTSREITSIDKYLQEISKIPLITSDEEIELTRRIKNGDPLALEKLIKSNLRFVISVAKQYQYSGLPLEDLINEGNAGLIKAAHRFDDSRGFKFISYGVWWVRQGILKAISEQSRMVRLPYNKIGTITKINKTYSTLEQINEREPSIEELSAMLNVPQEEIASAIRLSSRSISLDAPLNYDSGYSLSEMLPSSSTVPPDSVLHLESLKKDIQRAVIKLSAVKAEVLILYFGLNGSKPATLESIGEMLNLSGERVRQLKDKALSELRNMAISEVLKDYICK